MLNPISELKDDSKLFDEIVDVPNMKIMFIFSKKTRMCQAEHEVYFGE